MDAFTTLTATVVPLDRAHVDTDAILPKQYMTSIRRTGFGDALFDAWRYREPGRPGQAASERQPDPAFPLNQPRYAGAQILLARENFGCGSSREHAVWALRDFGIRALIAPSFADIFRGNCFLNGLLPIVLPPAIVQSLFEETAAQPGYRLHIDLRDQIVRTPRDRAVRFTLDADRKHRLLNGLDDIALTLARADRIREHEARRRLTEPWLFA